ncbi:hypothetical protein P879_10256 [Paragonimus westermani]|uniref:Uncharacterized protein n=1 Tax=Paragonimus westermani TaxID=34504 RepID=A0A8T0DB79_9TREM|nr:hypothetical protein P879_10256 [Paragonimus westermani]
MNQHIFVLLATVLNCSVNAQYNQNCIDDCRSNFFACNDVCWMSRMGRRACYEYCAETLTECLREICHADPSLVPIPLPIV